MIEGINASLASTQASRVQINTASTGKPFSAPATRATEKSLNVNYISPHVKIDSGAAIRAITQFRDNMNGEVLRQYPTESQLQAYARSQEFTSAQRANDVARALQAAQDAQMRMESVKQPISTEPVREPIVSEAVIEASSPAPEASPSPAVTQSSAVDSSVTEPTTTESQA